MLGTVQVIASARGPRCGLLDVTEAWERILSASEPPTGVLSRSDAFTICRSELGPRSRASIFRAFPLPVADRDWVVDKGSLEGGSLPRQLNTQYGRKRNAVAFSPGRLAARLNRWTRSARTSWWGNSTALQSRPLEYPNPCQMSSSLSWYVLVSRAGWMSHTACSGRAIVSKRYIQTQVDRPPTVWSPVGSATSSSSWQGEGCYSCYPERWESLAPAVGLARRSLDR